MEYKANDINTNIRNNYNNPYTIKEFISRLGVLTALSASPILHHI